MDRLALSLRAALIASLVVLVHAPASPAAEIEGVRFAETARAGDVSLELVDVAPLRWAWVLTPYVGAFYVGEGVEPSRWREDVPKRLELEYFYEIAGKKFGPAGEEILADNVSAAVLENLAERLTRIGRLYVDVVPGDRYALTYVPGRGTELAKNGEPLGVIEGADFAAAYFSIWLGESPISEAFRDELLSPP